MDQKLWQIIEESKNGVKNFNSEEQFENLVKIISSLDKPVIIELDNLWSEKVRDITHSPEFDKLYSSNGGIFDGGDDTFYMDFAGWIVSQGEELYNQFKSNGHAAIIDYINKNNISYKNYTYECMTYVFQDVWESRRDK